MTDREPDGAMNTDKPESRDALREAIRSAYLEHSLRCHDPEVCVDDRGSGDTWKGCGGHVADVAFDLLDREGRVPANDEPAPGTLDEEQRHVLQECLNEAKFKLTFNAEVKLGPLLSQRVYVLEDMLRSHAAANDEGAKIADEQITAEAERRYASWDNGNADRWVRGFTDGAKWAAAYIRRSAKP